MSLPDLDQANIDNLTMLYTHMGLAPPVQGLPDAVRLSASWPHRCFLAWDSPSDAVDGLSAQLTAVPERAIVPVWPWPNGRAEPLETALVETGFVKRSVLNAMVLDMATGQGTGAADPESRVITSPEDIATWTDVCSRGFGYAIDEAVIHRISTVPGLTLYLTYHEDQPAATALTLETGDTIGLHQLGVPKDFRGQGVGRRAMHHAMACCHASGCRYATLQASAAGEGIYRRLGFEVQFPIRNYQQT